jgi:ssDNA-binding replication factor A large subunit
MASEFIVKLDGIKLTSATEKQISEEIQSIVLRELAKIDTGGDFSAHIPRKEWIGLWARVRPLEGHDILQVNEIKR